MKICSICKKISAFDEDHLDCVEKRRVELEDNEFKESIPEKLDISKSNELDNGIQGILDHLSREKRRS
ncbi:MAG: hypothetical protein ACT4N5_07270 [Nitrosopumilaceae archaeon]